MDLNRFIYIGILLYVITFFILFIEFIAIPLLLPYGLPAIFPQIITYPLWLSIKVILIMICVAYTVFFLIMYIIWKIINLFVPKIFGIRKLFLRIPPLPQLNRAGIFRLFDGIFGSIFNRLAVSEKFKRFGKVILDFFISNKKIIADAVKPGLDKVAVTFNPPKSDNIDQVSNNKRPPKPDYITDTEKRTVDELYQQCLEEKLLNVSSKMNTLEKQSINIQNANSKTLCKIKMLQDNINLLSFK